MVWYGFAKASAVGKSDKGRRWALICRLLAFLPVPGASFTLMDYEYGTRITRYAQDLTSSERRRHHILHATAVIWSPMGSDDDQMQSTFKQQNIHLW